MQKTELLNKFAASQEERMLLSRVLDQDQLAALRGTPAHTAFLSPGECRIVHQLLTAAGSTRHIFSGGYEDAERQVCFFLPDWMEEPDTEDTLSALRLTWYEKDSLSHRDILGSLMGSGIKRETVGDLLVSDSACDLILLREMQPYVEQNLTAAGRVKLHLAPVALEHLHIPQQERKIIHATVASLRLDAIASSGFSLSRGKMADAISAGRVQLCYQLCTKTDALVREGDVISCRGLGKCQLTSVGGTSRKGRINITVERYL